MRPITHAQALRQLRQQPTWRLLSAENAPAIIALIQAHLLEGARKLPASLLVERMGRDLEGFRAFWRLLTDPRQSAELEAALETVMRRAFSTGLQRRERRDLSGLTGTLLERGGEVHDVLYQFARGLKQFVQSRDTASSGA